MQLDCIEVEVALSSYPANQLYSRQILSLVREKAGGWIRSDKMKDKYLNNFKKEMRKRKTKDKGCTLINSTQLYINNYLVAFTLNSHFYSHVAWENYYG